VHHDHEIIRVADDSVGGSAAFAVPVAGAAVAVRVPFGAEMLIKRRQGDVGEQRRGDAANAMGNFCFDVTLSYRRLERPRRVSGEA
jgi:hypothetical protein